MSDSVAKETANPVPPSQEAGTAPATNRPSEHDEKHKETSTTSSSHFTSSVSSHRLPPAAATGSATEENPADAQSTLVNTANPSPPLGTAENAQHDEKQSHIIEEKGLAATEVPVVKDGEGAASNAEPIAEDTEGDEVVYPGGLQLGLLTFGLCMATFTVALDNTIIATAIPKITTLFDSLPDVGWYGSSYLLTTTALQPSFGRIYTYFNVKYTYLFALCLFELGSILCAAAKNSVMLIVGRAVAGAGASALFSGGMTIVGFSVPLIKRPMYIATMSSMFGISSVVGPLLGGAFTDKVSWRWCFWINLPFGAISIVTVALFFKHPKRKHVNMTIKQKILEIDLVGAAFLICAIVCLLLALQWGGTTYPWSDSKVWGCLLGFGLLITVFILQQFRRGDRATIPPRIFGQRTVLWACLYSSFLSMGLYTHIYYLPFYFQAVKGTTAEGSGIRTIPYLISIILSAIVAGAGITTLGFFKPFMMFGSAIFTVGAGMIYTLRGSSSAGKWIGYQLLSGFGAGSGVQIPFIAVQVVLSDKDMPSGNAMTIFFNSLGGAISISIAQNIFYNGLHKYLPIYAPQIPPEVVIAAGPTHLREDIAPDVLPGVLRAYMKGLSQAYILPIAMSVVATVCACFVEWKSVKGKKLVAAAA